MALGRLSGGYVIRHFGTNQVLSASGALGALGHYCVAKAMTYASANFVAPFNYTQLVGAAILGYLVFDNIPDFWTWVGAAVIVCSGLYIGHQERLRYLALVRPNKN